MASQLLWLASLVTLCGHGGGAVGAASGLGLARLRPFPNFPEARAGRRKDHVSQSEHTKKPSCGAATVLVPARGKAVTARQ
jgi:hypothetical protein